MAKKSHVVEGQECPKCGYLMDRARHLTGPGQMPAAGDGSLCLNCGQLNLFDEELKLKEPDPMELLRFELSENWPQIQKGQRIIRARGPLPKKTNK